uniref:4a-hydroxytetrahydrobiopterin dehydratase n=1 Tax=Octactis speculum TaxID=3111310 RepID=A0A6U3RQ02_9STRA|mmetsp:Transcript_2772/g.3190  ORF Transcript_2772/g.3190 Transcript_2772/m.3190 type:complete len:180 (+) Transcript_2772:2-541(+)
MLRNLESISFLGFLALVGWGSCFLRLRKAQKALLTCLKRKDILEMMKEKQPHADKKCLPCEGLVDPSPADEVKRRLGNLPLWKLSEDGTKISRGFVAKNFQAALDWINTAGHIAELNGHHPDLHITQYRNVCVTLWTHSVGGLTENDFLLAEQLDTVAPVKYSPKWLKEHPEARHTTAK